MHTTLYFSVQSCNFNSSFVQEHSHLSCFLGIIEGHDGVALTTACCPLMFCPIREPNQVS
jgi:hypothetical protein